MNIIEENTYHLLKGIELMDSIPNEVYQNVPNGFLSGVGGHIRHIYDFYLCFINASKGTLNYDKRERRTEIENSKMEGMRAFESIMEFFNTISPVTFNDELIVICNESSVSSSPPMKSSFGRELQFLLTHTIHHFAIIKLILQNSGIYLNKDFGVAPSTIKFNQIKYGELERNIPSNPI